MSATYYSLFIDILNFIRDTQRVTYPAAFPLIASELCQFKAVIYAPFSCKFAKNTAFCILLIMIWSAAAVIAIPSLSTIN